MFFIFSYRDRVRIRCHRRLISWSLFSDWRKSLQPIPLLWQPSFNTPVQKTPCLQIEGAHAVGTRSMSHYSKEEREGGSRQMWKNRQMRIKVIERWEIEIKGWKEVVWVTEAPEETKEEWGVFLSQPGIFQASIENQSLLRLKEYLVPPLLWLQSPSVQINELLAIILSLSLSVSSPSHLSICFH